jgi:hypothetical protein
VLYTGADPTKSVTGVGFQPDLVWAKRRNVAATHNIVDAVRGASKYLYSNLTDAEGTYTDKLTSFDSDGFTCGTDVTGTGTINTAGDTFVAWCWKADNTSGSSNTDGSITSTVSANTDAGFSIVKWASSSYSDTIGHGLTQAPDMIIAKELDGSRNWLVYHSAVGDGYYAALNTNGAFVSPSVGRLDTVTSTTFICGTDYTNQIAYCFHSVDGFSKFGSYTGNGSSDGPFVYTGFRPAFVMVKRTDGGTNNWVIYDKERDPYNYVDSRLFPNTSGSESGGGASYSYDFTSNGFKLRSIGSEHNISGGTYIYMAFAENPFKYANAR